jgi:hypothetical protein
VQLINTDGLSLIGPGSEWFWTAISGVILAITFFAIYRQLHLQRDQAATEQLNGLVLEWSSERMCRAKLAILVALDAGTDSAHLPDRATAHIGFFWQRIGFLVRRGHMDLDLVYEHLGEQVEWWWALLFPNEPAVAASNDPAGWQHFAWLVAASASVDAKLGVKRYQHPATAMTEVSPMITHYRDAIELEEALRSVTVRLAVTPVPVTMAGPVPAQPALEEG